MSSLILFATNGAAGGGKAGAGGAAARRSDQMKVKEPADEVVQKLAASKNGFAEFSPENNPKQSVWVNRDHIKAVRSS